MEEDKKKADSSDKNERCTQEVVDRNKENERDTLKTPPLPNQKNSSSDNEDEVLESAKAEMGEVKEENERLKMYLERMMKDYRTLQMQFQGMVKKEGEKEAITDETPQETEESELVSLSLGRSVCVGKDKKVDGDNNNNDDEKEGLSLGLPITDNSSSDEVKEENGETTTTWPPSKVLKTMRSSSGGEDEVSQLNPAKRARVSVRVRCDAPTMNDGCQWRKYGQKIAKGNPCPRAYYRCTVAPSCPVRKQVQRCVDDMSILITTYEGTHNHHLPHSATAMASTTSAAACMLMSGSTTTSAATSMSPGNTITAAATTNLNGLNFYLSNSSKPNPFYIPTSSIAPTLGHPTIVLDLTSTAPSSSSSNPSRIGNIGTFPPRFSSTNLNFSSLESNPLPISWNLGTHQPYNKDHLTSSLSFGKQQQQQPPQDNQILFQSYLSKNNLNNNNNNNNIPSSSQSLPQETIAAATKAITADPNFQSALAAALSSIIGTNNGNGGTSLNLGIHGLAEKLSQNLKAPAEPFPILSSFSQSPNPNKCSSSSLLSRPATTTSSSANHPHPGNLMYNLQQTSKSKSSSPGDSRAETK